jgi:hypothetical protein
MPVPVSVKSNCARDQNPDRNQHRDAGDRLAPISRLQRVQVAAPDHLRERRRAGDSNRVGGR